MSIKYKIFLVILGMFLTPINVLADCIVTNNNFNKSSKIIFVNPNNGSDQLAKTYNLGNVRNPYEAKSVAAFQSIEKAKSLANLSNGDLVLIKAGPQWTNYDAWESNKLSDFNKEVMKAKVMSQGQCQGESLTWVPSAVSDKQPDQQPVKTDLLSNNDEVTLASTEETAPINLPNISSVNANASKNILSNSQQSLNTKRSNSSSAGGSVNKNSREDGKQEIKENVSSEIQNDNNKTIIKTTQNGNVSYTDSSNVRNAVDEKNSSVEVINIVNQPNIDESKNDIDNFACKVAKIGINMAGISYYSSGMPLVDLARAAQGWSSNPKLELDSNGYVKKIDDALPISIITDDLWGRDPIKDKRYLLLYDGEGTIEFRYSGKPKIIKSEPGRIEIELNRGRFAIVVTSTNPSNYIRNIRIIPVENEANYLKNRFRQDYVNKWQKFGVMRFLNPQQINNSEEKTWSDRKSLTQFGKKMGMSLEEIIYYSNQTNTSPWLLVPHKANDEYIRKMAGYVKNNLNSDLKVYLEYSNETWNFGFKQASYFAQLAKDNGTTQYYEYGSRAREVFQIWKGIFGSNRLVTIVGTHFVNPWISNQILKTPGLAEVSDALAVGYYIGYPLKDEDALNMSEDEILNFLMTKEIDRSRKLLTDQKQVADSYGLELMAYEAGQHLLARDKSNTVLVDKYTSVNRNEKMGQVYSEMYKLWNEVGGGLIMWFQTTGQPSKWGAWGLLESMEQNPIYAPKFRAVDQILTDKCSK